MFDSLLALYSSLIFSRSSLFYVSFGPFVSFLLNLDFIPAVSVQCGALSWRGHQLCLLTVSRKGPWSPG